MELVLKKLLSYICSRNWPDRSIQKYVINQNWPYQSVDISQSWTSIFISITNLLQELNTFFVEHNFSTQLLHVEMMYIVTTAWVGKKMQWQGLQIFLYILRSTIKLLLSSLIFFILYCDAFVLSLNLKSQPFNNPISS